ncbi:hypothetical protein WR25_23590 [Diploscapter pachys]|uniref:K Homology domain-containing protein n=1 Tax=Diploscapter pachys TaxID=2018661 RepID=A0A2A2L2Q8_9BILA|nr:hypothetical protein WR25_23590 [Diploscapter pachys]
MFLNFRMKEDNGVLTTTTTGVAWSQQPGSWFYEMGDDNSRGSPTNENADDLAMMRSLLGVRNVTESVEVPSSEHVAEIVGRQGCKIKALRAKTNTYIKTPVRGEEPVFVVTGRPEDVIEAKKEIECAAEHFTQIRASRRHSQGTASSSSVRGGTRSSSSTSPPLSLLNMPLFTLPAVTAPVLTMPAPVTMDAVFQQPPPSCLTPLSAVSSTPSPPPFSPSQTNQQQPLDGFNYSLPPHSQQSLVTVVDAPFDATRMFGGVPAPGHVTKYVRVPLRVVGLVVGPKGATIKRIQQDTHTYIITPSREREPIFEVTGLPHNVEAARKEIEQHIYQRTGNMPITDPQTSASHFSELQNHTQQTSLNNVLSGLSLDRLITELILAQQFTA